VPGSLSIDYGWAELPGGVGVALTRT